MSDPVDYYVAGILFLIKDIEGGFVSFDKLKSWGTSKSTAFGETYNVDYFEKSNLFEEAIKSLDKTSAIKVIDDPYGPKFLKVLKVGLLYEFEENEPNTVLSKTATFGESWITSALLKLNSLDLGVNEIVDEQTTVADWQPLQIERDDSVFQEGLKAVEEALKIIESDNGYAATEPEERNAILASAKGTVEALKDGNPSKQTVLATLVSPFKYMSKKFGDGIIGAAAKTIWEFGMKLLGF